MASGCSGLRPPAAKCIVPACAPLPSSPQRACRSPSRPSRAPRPRRSSPSGTRPSSASSSRRRSAARASPTEPSDIDAFLDEDDRLAPRALEEQRPRQDRAVRRRPRPGPLRVQPRLPGQRAESRLRLRALGSARDAGHGADGLRPRRDRPRPPGSALAPVLVLLPLQRLEQPPRGRLGDDPARLRRPRAPEEALEDAAARGRLQPARGRRAGGVGGRQARDRRRDAPGRLSGCRLTRELLLEDALFLGRSAEQGVGCDDTTGPSITLRPVVRTIPGDAAAAQAAYPGSPSRAAGASARRRSTTARPART